MIRLIVLIAIAAASQAQTADRNKPAGPLADGFYAAWHMQGAAKSETGTMVSFVERGDTIESNANGRTYSFKLDGREYPSGQPGEMTVWKRTSDRAYEVTQKSNNQVVSVTTMQIAPDGKTVAVSVTPKSGATPLPITMERTQGPTAAEPLIGFWKTIPASGSKVFEPASNGVRITSSAGDTYTGVFDGADYPMTGTAVPAGTTVSLKRIDDRTFEETRKVGGKQIAFLRFELSPDGTTLTQTFTDTRAGTAPATTKWVK